MWDDLSRLEKVRHLHLVWRFPETEVPHFNRIFLYQLIIQPFGAHGNLQWPPRNVIVRCGAVDRLLAIITRGRLGIPPLSNVSDLRYLLMLTNVD